MTRRKRIILISSLSTVPIAGIATIAITSLNKNINNSDEYSYLNDSRNWSRLDETSINENEQYIYSFNNNTYTSYDDIVDDFLSNNPNAISSQLMYLGIPNKDKNNEILNMEKLKQYNIDKLLPAYKIAGSSEYTDKESLAKKSYLTERNFVTKYSDFNGNLFISEKKAEESIRASKIPTPILYYNLPDGTKINPLSKTDLRLLKTDLYNNFRTYINANTEEERKQTNIGKSNYSLSIYDFSSSNSKNSSNNEYFSSANSSNYLNKDNYFKSIISDVLEEIYKAELEYINNNASFDVKVEVRNILRTWDKKLTQSTIDYNSLGYSGKYSGNAKWGISEFST
ncbi:MAG: hypothetical protein K2I49_02905, partial [Ureaplasma sp.]|nr:hypothetical protein [Ureaplasma sp.]